MSKGERKKIKGDDNDFTRLGSLLQKKRSREKSRRVDDILSMDIPPEEKIVLIDQVDKEKKTVELSKIQENSHDLASLLRRENIISREAARHLQKSIKVVPGKRKFIQFILHDYRELRAFCRRSSFTNVRFFPPRVSIDREMTELFFNRIRNDAAELVFSLKLILSIGWQHLDKMEYNLLVQLDMLCRRIIDTSIHLMDFRHGQVLGQISQLEGNFFLCHYKNNYPELIVLKLKEVISLHPELSINKNRIISLAQSILENSPHSMNLGSFITAANTARYRQVIPFSNLFRDEYPMIINNFDFECSGEVRHNIDRAIEKSTKELIRDLSQKREMEHVAAYVKITSDGSFEYQPLADFYNGTSKLHEGTFDVDRKKMLDFIIRFFDAFFSSFTDLLSGEVRFSDNRKGRIFSSAFFQFEMEKLYLLQQRLAKYPYAVKDFSRRDFTKMILNPGSESGPKRESAGIAREMLEHLASISEKLMRLLRGHNEGDRQYVAGDPRVISEEMIQQGSFAIPYYSEKILEGSEDGGETIREILTRVVSLMLLFTRFVKDERADLFLSGLERVNRSIAAAQERIRRLATVAEYQKMRDQHNF